MVGWLDLIYLAPMNITKDDTYELLEVIANYFNIAIKIAPERSNPFKFAEIYIQLKELP